MVYFSLKLHQSFCNVFWCFDVRFMQSKNCYALENWPLCCCVMPLFILDKFPCSEINMATPAFFWLVLVLHIFFISFTLTYVILYLKWVSYRQRSWVWQTSVLIGCFEIIHIWKHYWQYLPHLYLFSTGYICSLLLLYSSFLEFYHDL